MASHDAARRAVEAGYTDVSVMSDGIWGWKDSGQPVEFPIDNADYARHAHE